VPYVVRNQRQTFGLFQLSQKAAFSTVRYIGNTSFPTSLSRRLLRLGRGRGICPPSNAALVHMAENKDPLCLATGTGPRIGAASKAVALVDTATGGVAENKDPLCLATVAGIGAAVEALVVAAMEKKKEFHHLKTTPDYQT
jgi:hypothetical protein